MADTLASSLQVDPGLHDGHGQYVDAGVTRWADLSELQSLALVGVEAPNNVLREPLANLQELHLLHFEDDLDPSVRLAGGRSCGRKVKR